MNPTASPGAAPPWPAPAKLNLFLHITGRRPDGYHLLQTVFQFLDHGDTLEFQMRDDNLITLAGNHVDIPAAEDLIYRAALLLQQWTGIRRGADIRLQKRLPIGGGLGGGSSDAATTLVALNHYWNAGLSIPELSKLGLTLGADVPVFILGRAAWAEGVGEQLTPIDPPELWYVVARPRISIPTAEIFAAGDEQKRIAQSYITQLDRAKVFTRSIATKVTRLQAFYTAEAYHQDYVVHHPAQPYIRINDLPKVDRLREQFPRIFR